MANSILAATVAPVKIGHREIEGLLLETSEFAIAQQQVASLFSVIPTSAPAWIKTILGKDIQLLSVKTDRNLGTRQNRAEKALSIIHFERLLRNLDRDKNKLAREIVDELVGLSLTQLWSDAFSIQFEKQERQDWLKRRQENKDSFWELGDSIKTYLSNHPELSIGSRQWMYPNCQDAINRGLFGKSARQIREILQVSNLLRDNYGARALVHIEMVQRLAAQRIKLDKLPTDAVAESLILLNYPIINFNT